MNDPMERAAKRMTEHNISALPVVDEDQRVISMITSDGLSRHLSVQVEGQKGWSSARRVTACGLSIEDLVGIEKAEAFPKNLVKAP